MRRVLRHGRQPNGPGDERCPPYLGGRHQRGRLCASAAAVPVACAAGSVYIAPLEDAAQRAGSSRQTVEQVRRMEIADYATVMFDVMGFGKPLDETPLQLQPGLLATAWGSSIRQLAAGLGIDVDEITEAAGSPRRRRSSPPDTSQKVVRPRCVSRFVGMVKAHPAIVIEHVTRLSRCSGAVAVAEAACSGANMGLNSDEPG